MSGKITCYGCGKNMGSHSGEGETHGLCPSCHKAAMEEARQAAAEHRRRKEER
jgi:hypothetical protein